MSIDEFWNSTPYELNLVTRSRHKAERQRLLFLAWHIAALMRTDTMPTFDELMKEPRTPSELELERQVHEKEFGSLLAALENSERDTR
jgi:hypothetical protein